MTRHREGPCYREIIPLNQAVADVSSSFFPDKIAQISVISEKMSLPRSTSEDSLWDPDPDTHIPFRMMIIALAS